ncbi:MAG: 50S ribosomal protein L1 [Candidatus Aenigmarchaeota archaeon]|nr:50S ribosomal protein L1 [Candidatus Aenigmarchaeota archaeon]
MKIDEALKELDKEKRNFSQSYDLAFSLKNINLKNPENKFTKEIVLPHGHGKNILVGLISSNGDIKKSDLEAISDDKKAVKELIKKYDFFIAEMPLMPLVGKVLGRYLAPTGRMPKPMPPGTDPKLMIEAAKKSIRIRLKDSPTIHCIIGKESMSHEQIKENAIAVIEEVKKALPKGENQIKNIFLKKTMSRPVKIEV